MDSSSKKDLLRFDLEKATDEQIRAWLFAIIDAELEKDDEDIDEELIKECSECETYLEGNVREITAEEYAVGLERIKERVKAISAEGSETVVINIKPRKIFKKRHFIAILAAALSFVVLSVGAAAAFKATGALDFIINNIRLILNMDSGDALQDNGVTLIKGEAMQEYSSVEDALKSGGFEGVLYPATLPEGIKIKRIVQTFANDETEYRLLFVFNTPDISYMIANYEYTNYQGSNTDIKYTVGNIVFYISQIGNGSKYQAVGYNNGLEYTVNCTNYDDMINILNNMEENE